MQRSDSSDDEMTSSYEEGSSEESEDDEAEKFRNTLLKSQSKEAKMYLISNHFQENNLLAIKSDQRMSMIEEEFDLERVDT